MMINGLADICIRTIDRALATDDGVQEKSYGFHGKAPYTFCVGKDS
jgi:hypothetical protein